MPLLDLPRELFQQIIRDHINEVGIVEAWKDRATCGTFAIAIEEIVFGELPPSGFSENDHTKALLRNGTARFLEYHSAKSRRGIDQTLPSLVREVSNWIALVLPKNSQSQIRAEVSKIVAKHCKLYETTAYEHILHNNVSRVVPSLIWGPDNTIQDALCVALVMQRPDVMRSLLSMGASMWQKTRTFGLPIQLAVATRNMHNVNLVLAYSTIINTKVSKDVQCRLFSTVLDEMQLVMFGARSGHKVEIGSFDKWTMKRLVQWYSENMVLSSSWTQIMGWAASVEWSWRLHDMKLLARVIDIPISPTADVPTVQDYMQRRFTDVYFGPCIGPSLPITLLENLFTKRILRGKSLYICPNMDYIEEYDRGPCTTVLDYAVYKGLQEVVRLALEWDAPTWGTQILGTTMYTWPIRYAIKSNQIGIVKTLLEYGADPNGGSDDPIWGQVNALELTEPFSEMWHILAGAMLKNAYSFESLRKQGKELFGPEG